MHVSGRFAWRRAATRARAQVCARGPAGSRRRVFSIGHRLGNYECDQARAKQDETGHGHSEETVRSEFFTHGTPPVACPCSNGTTVPLHSQKDSLPDPISIRVDALMNTLAGIAGKVRA